VKVGKYDIPDMRLYPSLFDATKKLYEHFKSEEATDELTVAKLLGHETNKSGAFLHKLAYLRAYGLVEKRGIKVTDLGKKLTYDPSEDERNKALKEVLLNIPLWKELHSKFGNTLPTSNFWVELTKITGLEAPDAQKMENIVRNAYLDDIRYLKAEKKAEKEVVDVTTETKVDTSMAVSEGSLARFTLKDTGYVDVKDKDTFEIAKAYLKVLAKKLGIKEEEG